MGFAETVGLRNLGSLESGKMYCGVAVIVFSLSNFMEKTTARLFRSSLGKKYVMAVSGVILLLFVIGHLIGNLQIFAHPDVINAYAHFLQNLGPGLWAVRLILLATVVAHIWSAVDLTIENRRARPESYEVKDTIQASYASRTMRISGFIVLAFILFHLAHFTLQVVNPEYQDLYTELADGTVVHDVHTMMVAGFQNVWISVFYIVAIGLLSVHLRHGIASMLQSVGWRNRKIAGPLEKVSIGLSILYFAGNAAIPLAVMAGFVS